MRCAFQYPSVALNTCSCVTAYIKIQCHLSSGINPDLHRNSIRISSLTFASNASSRNRPRKDRGLSLSRCTVVSNRLRKRSRSYSAT